jgi:hypothetical protein
VIDVAANVVARTAGATRMEILQILDSNDHLAPKELSSVNSSFRNIERVVAISET